MFSFRTVSAVTCPLEHFSNMKSSIVWAEVQALSGLAAPVVITYLLQLGISLSTTVIVGQLPTATPLGAATLANMWVNSTGFAVI